MKRGFEIVTGFNDVVLPKRATKYSAGYDFHTIEKVEIAPQEKVLVKTGVKSYMQNDEVLKIFIRSSLAVKKGVILTNNVGIIDADYYNNENNEGHIMICLTNTNNESVIIEKHERIAQGIFEKYLVCDEEEVADSRVGGFGSSN